MFGRGVLPAVDRGHAPKHVEGSCAVRVLKRES